MNLWRRELDPVEVDAMSHVDEASMGIELVPDDEPSNGDAPGGSYRRPSLSALLTESGILTEDQVREALDEGTRTGEKLGEVVVRRGWASEEQLAQLLAEQWGLTAVDPGALSLDPLAVARLEAGRASELGGFPVWFDQRGVVVAVAEPSEERFTSFRELLGEVSFVVVSRSTLEELLESRLFGGEARDARPVVQLVNGYTDTVQADDGFGGPGDDGSAEEAVGPALLDAASVSESLAAHLRAIEAEVQELERALAAAHGSLEGLQAELAELRGARERDLGTIRDLEARLGERDERARALREKVAELSVVLES
jgi:hypothetical protein